MNPKVDFYFKKGNWQKELRKLRTIVLDCGLIEELKWGVPCYTNGKANVVLLHVFKDYCAVLFFKGALLKDPDGVLIQQTANVQAARQLRFTDLREVESKERLLKSYLAEAIEVEKAGLKVAMKTSADFEIAEEFSRKLDELPSLRSAFYSLTPGRQRAYLLYFSSPRQPRTRESRVEKCLPQILDGKGLTD